MTDSTLIAMTAKHRDLVRRLAFHLVQDQTESDDLVQETWLAAVQRPPREPDAARAWISSTLRRITGKRNRGEGRRRARERAYAPSERVSSAQEIVERVELEQRVVRAVMALREPYRTAILLRYYEGLDGAAIARRLGISATAARARLWRGIRDLRAHLDEGSPDGRDWRQGLAIGFGIDVGGTCTATATPLGSSIMSVPVLCASALTLCVTGVAVYVAVERDGDDAPPIQASATLDDLGAEADAPTSGDPRRATAPAASNTIDTLPANVDVARGGVGSVSLWVADPLGRPLDATVRFASQTRFGETFLSGSGEARLNAGRYQAAIRAAGFEDATIDVEVRRDEVTDIGAVTLIPGSSVLDVEIRAPHLDADRPILVQLHGSIGARAPQAEALLDDYTSAAVDPAPVLSEIPLVSAAFGSSAPSPIGAYSFRGRELDNPYRTSQQVTLGDGAHARFEALPAGLFHVTVTDPESGHFELRSVRIALGSRATVRVALPAIAEASLAIVDPVGAPVMLATMDGVDDTVMEEEPSIDFEIVDARGTVVAWWIHSNFDEMVESAFEMASNYERDTGPIDRERGPSDELLPDRAAPHVVATIATGEHLGGGIYRLGSLPAEPVEVRVRHGDLTGRVKLDLTGGGAPITRVVLERETK